MGLDDRLAIREREESEDGSMRRRKGSDCAGSPGTTRRGGGIMRRLSMRRNSVKDNLAEEKIETSGPEGRPRRQSMRRGSVGTMRNAEWNASDDSPSQPARHSARDTATNADALREADARFSHIEALIVSECERTRAEVRRRVSNLESKVDSQMRELREMQQSMSTIKKTNQLGLGAF